MKIMENVTHMLSNMKIMSVTHKLSSTRAKTVMEAAMAEKSQAMVTMTRKRDTVTAKVTRPKIPVTIATKPMKHGDLLTQSIG